MRRHLVELEDLEFCPDVVRDGATAFLRTVGRLSGIERIFISDVKETLKNSRHQHIVDLCSGGGGPLPEIIDAIYREGMAITATMTDKFPNQSQLAYLTKDHPFLIFSADSVDATDVNSKLKGMRTLFNAFHHFRPEQAKAILADAVSKNQPIGIFEIVERTPGAFISVFIALLGVFVLTPFIKPFQAKRLFFTYILPLIPFLILWDGCVSCMRVYSLAELRALINDIPDQEKFIWEIKRKRLPYLLAHSTILIGRPLPTGVESV
jgi:hypothetical protein